jgi:hypothetical protein
LSVLVSVDPRKQEFSRGQLLTGWCALDIEFEFSRILRGLERSRGLEMVLIYCQVKFLQYVAFRPLLL